MNQTHRQCVCSFTGHRTIQFKDRNIVEHRLKAAIYKAAQEGVTDFVCGGAVGFDMLAGFAVIDMKRTNSNFRLLLVLPCKDQDARWTAAQRAAYQQLLQCADSVTYLSDSYTEDCMKRRNQAMVDMSGYIIAYLRRGGTGTSQTVRMAREADLKIFLV